MKAQILSFLKYVFFLGIGALFLYFVLRDQDIDKMLQDLRNAKYGYLIFSMIFGYAAYVFRGLRWLLLLKTMNYKTSANLATQAIASGYLANAIFPRAGEIVRCTSLYKVTGIPVNKLFGTILLERAVDLVLLVLCITLSFVLKFSELSNFFTSISNETEPNEASNTPILILAAVVVIVGALYFFRNALKNSKLYLKVVALWEGVKEGFKTAFYMKEKSLFILYSLLIWLMYLLMTYICFFSVPETSNLSLVDGLYIMVIGGLGMIVPVQGGLGPYHAAVTLGIASIGLAESTGITLAVLIHTAQSIMIIITGIIAAIVLSFAKRKAGHHEASDAPSV